MSTPEGRVKDAIKKELRGYGVVPFSDVVSGKATEYAGFYYMPVAGPFAVHGVHDFVGCWNGIFWSLETKAPDNSQDATTHQRKFLEASTATGGVSFVGVRDASVVSALATIIHDRSH